MPNKTLGQLIQELAIKSGIESDNADLINLLSNAELSKVPAHSNIENAIAQNLVSLDVAKANHPDIKKVYDAQALNAFDTRMKAVMEGAELSDEAKARLEGERSTYKRFELLVEELKAATEAKAKKGGTEDKTALQQQVDKLLSDLKAAKEETATRVAEVEGQRKGDRIRYALSAELAGLRTIYDELDPTVKQMTLDSLIKKALQDKKAEFDFDGDTLVLRGEGGTAVLGESQVSLTPKALIEQTLAQNKVLDVSDPAKAQKQQQQQGGISQGQSLTANTPAVNGNNQTTANLNRIARERAQVGMQQS